MLAEVLRSALRVLILLFEHIAAVTVRFMTLPYYRLYYFNTSAPLARIAALASEQPLDTAKVMKAISSWRVRKLTELQFITIAVSPAPTKQARCKIRLTPQCTVLAAAVIGSFSWTIIEDAYWLTHGFWHSSLIFSVLGILLSASEVTVLHLLGPLRHTGQFNRDEQTARKYYPLLLSPSVEIGQFTPRLKMIFTWQAPLMFMSYSVCGFLVGLTVLVCTPLLREDHTWTVGHNIAIMYLTVFVGAGTTFVFCSFWVYHYVQLDLDAGDTGSHNNDDVDGGVGLEVMLTPFSGEVRGATGGSSGLKMDRRYTSWT
ncbi:uncharacterized protein M421DRAFT_383171 [Didymella exigua CBS 183.55]|uniref:Uncharacterized protein n=1 Tax=Didymella exigua CBS 183.55 TaxID=1150837 RepID=A0A6A5RQG2_9PLEO|nr:uncharacterized protein M421DRAFT_383171 [Didymella exigua CBS 183.55]KAF1930022.1 hypothetical protein M421DRAFT_383171 [Didymella exigua CBS 183.55]